MTEEYFSWRIRVLLAMWGAIYGGVAGVPALALLQGTTIEAVGALTVLALAVAGVWRGATARVSESADGLVVRNLFRTYVIRWADVTEVDRCGFLVAWEDATPCLRVRGRRRRVPLLAMTGIGKFFSEREARADERAEAAYQRWKRMTR